MDLERARKILEEQGEDVRFVKEGGSRALVVQRMPALGESESTSLWVVEGEIAELLKPGQRAGGAEELQVGDEKVRATRVTSSPLLGHGSKIGEGSGNLRDRGEWFKKRH